MSHSALKQYFLNLLPFSPQELEAIAQFYEERLICKGEYVLQKGEVCDFEGYVVKGCFRVFVVDEKGDEKILYFAARDWWVMEIDSFANQIASQLSIQAIEDSTLLTISRRDKERLYEQIPRAERLFRIMSQRAVAAWQRRLVRNHTLSAEARYQHFLTTYPEIAQRVTNKFIASYLGITQEFLSVIRKRLAERKA